MSGTLDKTYEHSKVEAKWYTWWEENGFFRAVDDDERPSFTLVIPPPNVTGVLHVGHALTYSIQDTIIRWKRMCGFNTLWVPGTDHAGIATQMLVERHLMKEQGLSRHDLGREKFLEAVWKWTRDHQGGITNQSRHMGISVDWERERFTLDEGLSKSVREAFVRLYEEGLLYRAKRMVNWSPAIHTVLSDLEVVHKDVEGAYWHIAYPLADDPTRSIVVATTRPETMFGDTAVAVHPEDERYLDIIGKQVILPLTGRTIPIIADEILADMTKGTGAVKVTPAHDPNDFECGLRNNLPLVNIMDDDARLNDQVPGKYQGMDRFEARELVVADLEAQGLLLKTEKMTHPVGHCMRSGVMVEPRASEQWFVNMGTPDDPRGIAGAAIKAARDGDVRFVPDRWTKEFYRWLEDIRDWCVSRQLWWGHRIPAWYCADCGEVTVTREDPTVCIHCGSAAIRQDDDVLDTWFSSALWPFSTLGWPEKTPALRTFYPNSIMETGFDILFFWVARMIMMGIKLTGEVPFKDVYLHAMVRDAKGEKMSKTKGNVVDPLVVTREHGADALRFTLISLTAQGRDIKLSLDRVEGNRAFLNKIWNATRFVLMHLEGAEILPVDQLADRLSIEDKWILTRLGLAVGEATTALEEYRFNDYASGCYRFVWQEFCSWYLELAKDTLYSEDEDAKLVTRSVLAHVLESALRLLHPVIPFITEELWQMLPGHESGSIMVASWPKVDDALMFAQVAEEFQIALDNIGAVRTVRSLNRIAPKQGVKVTIKPRTPEVGDLMTRVTPFFVRLAGVEELLVNLSADRPSASGAAVTDTAQLFVHLAGLVDLDEERARLKTAMDKLSKDNKGLEAKLSNQGFLAKAPEDVVALQKERLEENTRKIQELSEHLASISD